MRTLPMAIDAEGYLFLAVKALACNARDEDYLTEAMRSYAALRIAEHLEAQRRDADGADIYAAYQLSFPLNARAGAAGDDAGA